MREITVNLLYPDLDFDLSKFNKKENTFSDSYNGNPWTFEWLCSHICLNFKKTITPIPLEKNFYIFNLLLPIDYLDLENVPNHVWETIKNNDNVDLLLYHGVESAPYYYYKPRWEKLVDFLKNKNIPPEKIYYITGDILSTLRHKNLEHKYLNKINTIGIDVFEAIHLIRHIRSNGFNFLNAIELYKNTEKKKDFLCLNNIMRPHRQVLVYYLKKSGLIDSALISARWENNRDELLDKNTFDYWYNYDNSDYEDFKKTFPLRIDIDDTEDHESPNDFYSTTYFSLVSETQVHKDTTFITEKTYKPILMGHPFMIFGSPNTLEYLRKNGYETFPEIFDESYDSLIMPKDRIKIILENCRRKFKITDLLLEKLNKNQINFGRQMATKKTKFFVINFLSLL